MAITRSENMRRIKSKDTTLEVRVRKILREMGFPGYRIHCKLLPGKPDIAFIGRKKAIFINGCFWHGHDCKEGLRKPKSNIDYWIPKIERTKQRDSQHVSRMNELGWDVITIWECEMQEETKVRLRLKQFMLPQILL